MGDRLRTRPSRSPSASRSISHPPSPLTRMYVQRQPTLGAGSDRALQALRREQGQLSNALATGLRIQHASDDPAGFARARALEGAERAHAQYARNVDASRLFTDATQSALDGLTNHLADALATGVRAANGSLSVEDREALARSVEANAANAVRTVNGRVGDQYLFGGTRNAAPVDANGAPTGALDGALTLRIGPGSEVEVTVPGDRVLGEPAGPTLFDRLRTLAAAIRGGDPAAIGAAHTGVEAARDHVTALAAGYGDTARTISAAETGLAEAQTLLADRRGAAEGADLAETIGRLTQVQTALEAALRSTAALRQTSLLDYLR